MGGQPPILFYSMNIKIDFDNNLTLTVRLDNNDFLNRWCALLEQEISKDTLLQEDTYSCFFTEEQSRCRLDSAINIVNSFLNTEFVSLPTVDDYSNPDYYNELHLKFEKLAGPDWEKPTRLMTFAPNDVKLAVRHINRYCHRLEQKPYRVDPLMRVEFDTYTRESFKPEDYDLFYNYDEVNDVVLLDYSTLGKSLFECYEDYLSPSYSGLKIQHHYSANFILKFGKVQYRRSKQEFSNWLNEHGLTNLPKSVYGHIKLGEIVEKNLLQKVQESAKILKIRLE